MKLAVLFGTDACRIKRSIAGRTQIVDCSDLASAFRKAMTNAREGDIVLLSPACASFDQFENYLERGQAFDAIVSAYDTSQDGSGS